MRGWESEGGGLWKYKIQTIMEVTYFGIRYSRSQNTGGVGD